MKKKRKISKNSNYYVDPDELRNEIIKSKKNGELTPRSLDMLILMSDEIAKNFTYKYHQDREDCVSSAIEDILRYWKGYDEEKSDNAFAYFTRMIWNGLKKGWNKLYKIKSINKVSLSHENLYNF